MPTSRRKWIGLAIAGLVATALLAWLLRPRRVRVEVAPVTRGPMRVTVDEDGRTRVADRYVVSAPLAGRLERITLEPGDAVRAGQVVARIWPAEPALLDPRTRAELEARVRAAEAGRAQARAAVERAKVARALAESELARRRLLTAQGAAARRDLEIAEAELAARNKELASAHAGEAVARYELEVARAALRRSDDRSAARPFEVRAPIDGRVLRLRQESEAVLAPGTPLLELGDPSALEVVVDVLTTDAVRIAPGAPAEVHRWGGGEALPARVRRVEPGGFTKLSALGVEEQRVNVILDLLGPPSARARLGDDFRVEARIVTWQSDRVLRVPASAPFRHGDGWAVFVVEGRRARLQPIALGHRGTDVYEVLGGLEAGQEVVLHPGERLRDGVRVRALQSP